MSGSVKNAVTKKRASSASRKPSRKTADKAQFERFVEAARQAQVDEDPKALDRALDQIVSRPASN
jgi:hypothetical protein